MKKQLIRATASAVLAAGLTAGFAGFAAADINTTGPQSNNTESSKVSNDVHVDNENHLGFSSANDQGASSGNAQTRDNTTGGGATTGDASNGNKVSADVTVDNTGSDAGMAGMNGGSSDPVDLGSISNTGPNSENKISSTVDNDFSVTNNNDVQVSTDNSQHASTGNADVSDNTTGGDAMSGNASNSNSSNFTLSVNN
jgi:hypothetical protein